MPTAFGLNRPRLDLTGLEEPEELWDRLQEATAEAQNLAASNKKLAARVRLLERKLSEVGSLTDDELVAELPRRMTRALESAQGVANEIVQRAKKHEATTRQKAAESAAAIVQQAEGRAAQIMNDAKEKSAAHVASAEAKALDIIGSAHARRKQVLSELEEEALKLEQRLTRLRKHQARVLQAYDVVERSLVEARAALGQEPSTPAVDLPRGSDAGAEGNGTGGEGTGRAKPGAARLRVYDWSPAASTAG